MYIYQLPFNILHSTYYDMYLHNKNTLVLYVLIASTIQCLTLQNLPNSNTTYLINVPSKLEVPTYKCTKYISKSIFQKVTYKAREV